MTQIRIVYYGKEGKVLGEEDTAYEWTVEVRQEVTEWLHDHTITHTLPYDQFTLEPYESRKEGAPAPEETAEEKKGETSPLPSLSVQ